MEIVEIVIANMKKEERMICVSFLKPCWKIGASHAKIWSLLRHFIDQRYKKLFSSSTIDENSQDTDCKHEKMQTKDMCPISVTLSQNWCLACQNFGHFCAILSTKGTNNTSVAEVMGVGGNLPPPPNSTRFVNFP